MANKTASSMVQYAVKHGFLPHPSTLECFDCKSMATEYDHRNYDYPLSVDPVCHRCNILRGKACGDHEHVNKDPNMTILAFYASTSLIKQLKDIASKEHRSVNNQIIHILQETADMIKHQYKKRSKGQIK